MKEEIDYYIHNRTEIASFVPSNIKSILDISCGQGEFLRFIKEQTGAETWGIEIIASIANKAKNNADYIFTGSIEELISSIPDNYFDCVSFNDVLEHLIDPTNALKMIIPKLSNDGIVIASIPNVRFFFNLYELIIKKDWEYKEVGILDSTHLRFFTKKSMRRMFTYANLNLLKQEGINETRRKKFRLFNIITLGLFNDTKYPQIVCIAGKNK